MDKSNRREQMITRVLSLLEENERQLKELQQILKEIEEAEEEDLVGV